VQNRHHPVVAPRQLGFVIRFGTGAVVVVFLLLALTSIDCMSAAIKPDHLSRFGLAR
jgi:hypothetical protein